MVAKVKDSTPKRNEYTGCYGPKLIASDISKWAVGICLDNFDCAERGLRRWTGNIWGETGSGKTTVMKDLAHYPITYKGKKYDGFQIVDVPLAQIEEMGDILGMPDDFVEMMLDGTNKWVLNRDSLIQRMVNQGWAETGKMKTDYAQPSWVPTEERPGIILFDDGNRANSRIKKGMMQLEQDYKTISWSIPHGWTIIYTGNPDNNQYMVQSQDIAQLTRQKHVTFKDDIREWATWATAHKVDPRGINFLLAYPEMMRGTRTNPRTLTEFFRSIEKYPDLENNKREILIAGGSLLDDITVETFVTFISRNIKVFEPEEVLTNSAKVIKAMDKLMNEVNKETGRVEARIDVLSITIDRVAAYLNVPGYEPTPTHIENFAKFMLSQDSNNKQIIKRDMLYANLKRISSNHALHPMFNSNPEFMKMVSEAMQMVNTAGGI